MPLSHPEGLGSSPPSSIAPSRSHRRRTIGSNEFRNHLGYHIERAAAGEELFVTRRGKAFVHVLPAGDSLRAVR